MQTDAARLATIRSRLNAIAPGRWTLVYDGDGCFVESQGPMGELLRVLRFDPSASTDEIMIVTDLPEAMQFLIDLVDRAIERLRPARQDTGQGRAVEREREPKDFAAECAMKCNEPAFKVWLEQVHGLERPLTDERVAQKVRSLLGVTSRKELNDGGRAGEAWKALRADFATWRKGN
jgi:hypothetical protein